MKGDWKATIEQGQAGMRDLALLYSTLWHCLVKSGLPEQAATTIAAAYVRSSAKKSGGEKRT